MGEFGFGKITHLEDPTIRKMPKGFVWESRIPCSILVYDLCGIEAYIASFRYRGQI